MKSIIFSIYIRQKRTNLHQNVNEIKEVNNLCLKKSLMHKNSGVNKCNCMIFFSNESLVQHNVHGH